MWSFLGIALSSALTVVSLVLTRHAARDGVRREGRSETYGLLRWAADLALRDSARPRLAGLRILRALAVSPLIDPADLDLVAAVLAAASER